MALNYVTLTPDVFDGQGNIPTTGTATFTPSAVLTDSTDLEIIGQQPIVASYRLAGLPPVSLLATDSSGPVPTGWTWGVTFSGITGAPASFSFFLPANPVTYTATNANPAVFTVGAGSAPPNGTGIQLLTGAPTGFTNLTTYFVVGASGATFRLATVIGGAQIASTSTGAGNMITVTQRLSNLAPAQSGTAFASFLPLTGGTLTGLLTENAGTSTSGSAPALTPTFANGTAAQLSDTTRDYMVYLTVGTAGTAFILAIGPTSGVANTVVPSSAAVSGAMYAVRLPAGWFLKWSATTATLAGQLAVGC